MKQKEFVRLGEGGKTTQCITSMRATTSIKEDNQMLSKNSYILVSIILHLKKVQVGPSLNIK
jgi:hypothetical protein